MENTKNDISGNEVKLDYDAMIRTAGIAYRASKEEISSYLDKLYVADEKADSTSRYLTATWLKHAATNLAIAAETYSTLLEGKTREQKTLVNLQQVV